MVPGRAAEAASLESVVARHLQARQAAANRRRQRPDNGQNRRRDFRMNAPPMPNTGVASLVRTTHPVARRNGGLGRLTGSSYFRLAVFMTSGAVVLPSAMHETLAEGQTSEGQE